MPRIARVVFAGLPHHVTQRGNRREEVFFRDSDRVTYLDWLREYCLASRVEVLAYCLMSNHVHLVLVPETNDGLEKVLRPLHMRYAQRVNRLRLTSGHLWQGRYFSSVLDESYLWAAIGYVERNPVRAGMAHAAQDYRWSSARAHCRVRPDALLTQDRHWSETIASIPDWAAWLAQADPQDKLQRLREHTNKGVPCGSDAFVKDLEVRSGRQLVPRSQGRPRNAEKGLRPLFEEQEEKGLRPLFQV